MKSGLFITFEGGEGTGKSTQARKLAAYLEKNGTDVVLTREPGGTPSGEIVRKIVLSGAAEPLGPLMEAVLMNSARDDHLNHVIRPALKAGKTVISDRFSDSTLAYQGIVGGIDLDQLREMEDAVLGDTRPDITFVLDAPVKESVERARKASEEAGEALPDRFERENLTTHSKLRKAFKSLAAENPERMVLIEASGSKATVWKRILAAFNARVKEKA